MTKVKDLTPESKQVNVLAKVVGLSEEKELTSRYGEKRRLVEAKVGDDTGTVLLTLWNEQIGQVREGDTVFVDNGYVTLVRGHVRLNVGKYGALTKSEEDIETVNSSLDVSAVEYERERRYRSGGYSGGGGQRDRPRQYEYGTSDRSGGRDRRDRGRRRY